MTKIILPLFLIVASMGCGNTRSHKKSSNSKIDSGFYSGDTLPLPFATESARNFSKVIGWPAGKTPVAPQGFVVTRFADSLDNPRWIYVGGNGDVFIAESNTILKGIKKFGAKIFTDGLKHSMQLPYQEFEDQRSGETLSILTKVRTDTERFIISFINVLFSILVGIVFISVYSFRLHWSIMPIYVVGIILFSCSGNW